MNGSTEFSAANTQAVAPSLTGLIGRKQRRAVAADVQHDRA